MKIEQIVHNELNNTSKPEILKKLGYSSEQKASLALEKFLKSNNLHEWLHSGFYDFKYTAQSFFKKLCRILNIDTNIIEKALRFDMKLSLEIKKFENSYIFIDTNFKRTTQPIHALAFMESKRRLKLPKEQLLFQTDDEILSLIGKFIQKHYKLSNGDIGIWGKIVHYVLHYKNEKYIFDIKGKLLSDMEIFENIAILKV